MSTLFDHPMMSRRDERWTVLFTRGKGCAFLADVVSEGTASRVDGDLKTACIAAGANVLVTAKAGSFDLASTLVPQSVDEEHDPPAVIGAVGTGPHSGLVAAATMRLAKGFGADPMLVTMSAEVREDPQAQEVLDEMALAAPGAATRLVRAGHPAELLASLPPEGLVVLGAPGGSWWQRQFFGAGRKLIHAAPAGSVIVHAAPLRCFQALEELVAFGPLMRAADAAAVIQDQVAPVVDEGKLIGQVRRGALLGALPDTPVGELAEAPIAAIAEEPVAAIDELTDRLDGSPVPVVDDENRLLGGVRPATSD